MMIQDDRRKFLIRYLLEEDKRYQDIEFPDNITEQKKLLRSLMNIRMPKKISDDFLVVQNEYLKEEIAEKGIIDLADLNEIDKDLYLWQGDITTLKCDGIVNAANSGMTGCYVPCHSCIDNCIHTYAGIQLRNCCADIMKKQGHEEETGKAKITPAFNLPCRYVIHTVGPIVYGSLNKRHEEELSSCYRSCLEIACNNGLQSIAFCCISTGEFHFPNEEAAEIAVRTVKDFKKKNNSTIKVIFNVFKDTDLKIYSRILTNGSHQS